MTPQPILLSQEEIEQLRKEVGRPTLMGKSIAKHIAEVDAYMALGLDVPGHGEAGGYEHNRHKQNYTYMNIAGRLFLITQEEKYATFVKDLLNWYADKYLTLDYQVQKNTNLPVVYSTRF
ncbi:poly(beta-D-mannuronate) lyase [Vibrio ishigakensis]|uniref:Poly(Beta-D-mannuronate) lyase n=1 Tax=Vibrio ishigakensis TaxID=1481914 RepID=A0A0B8QE57_9VIBR|nr:poly(beta-D-mannuronate) lyase [Vibrio sp. JCM 19236]GAM77920.1 poly(beta-D-mannuronate) lyase [Vibrio ishigakensis]